MSRPARKLKVMRSAVVAPRDPQHILSEETQASEVAPRTLTYSFSHGDQSNDARRTSSREVARRYAPSHADVASVKDAEMESAIERSRDVNDDRTTVTELLADLRAGRPDAFDRILPLVYQELRRTARRELAVRPSDTLSTTALVHELYLKFSRSQHTDWHTRAHFLGVAAVAMRHILVDRARRRTAEKRGGAHAAITLDDALVAIDTQAESLLELHEALDHLATLNPRLARVVECRFFGGMTEQETAEALSITERTVRRDWVKARGLLYQALGAEFGHDIDPSRTLPRNR
jgi:RNA polymerase sigma factor (TIGR02999 family)